MQISHLNSLPLSGLSSIFSLNWYQKLSTTDWKTHCFVVLGYLLIGIGILLTFGSYYLSTMMHPMAAVILPVAPLTVGIYSVNKLLNKTSLSSSKTFMKNQPLPLKNGACNCFLNAAFQMICNSDAFAHIFKKSSYVKLLPLIDTYWQYKKEQRENTSSDYVSKIDTQDLRLWLSKLRSEISPKITKQHDPMTLFEELYSIANTHLDLNQQITRKYANGANVPEKSTKCQFINIDLDINPNQNERFSKLFHRFFHTTFNDTVTTTSGIFNADHIQKKWFTKPPDDFLVVARRYTVDEQTRDKNGKFLEKDVRNLIDFPINLQLTKEQCPSKQENYFVDSFIVQRGTLSSGHYIAYIFKNGQWFEANDARISLINEATAQEQLERAYIVHYQKKPLFFGCD